MAALTRRGYGRFATQQSLDKHLAEGRVRPSADIRTQVPNDKKVRSRRTLISRLSRLQAVTQKFDEALRRCRKRACFDGGEDRAAALTQTAKSSATISSAKRAMPKSSVASYPTCGACSRFEECRNGLTASDLEQERSKTGPPHCSFVGGEPAFTSHRMQGDGSGCVKHCSGVSSTQYVLPLPPSVLPHRSPSRFRAPHAR